MGNNQVVAPSICVPINSKSVDCELQAIYEIMDIPTIQPLNLGAWSERPPIEPVPVSRPKAFMQSLAWAWQRDIPEQGVLVVYRKCWPPRPCGAKVYLSNANEAATSFFPTAVAVLVRHTRSSSSVYKG